MAADEVTVPIPVGLAVILADPEQPPEVRERFIAGMRRRGLVLRRSGVVDGGWLFELDPSLIADPVVAAEVREILGGGEGAGS